MAADSKSDTYMLERGWIESIRLNAQHQMLKERIGWTIEPRLTNYIRDNVSKASSTSPFCVADIATGTGILALELASEFPSVGEKLSITALDISDDQYPHPVTVPSNVHFGLYNVFETPPPEYTAAFDVIHVRLIVAALVQGGQDNVLRNLRAMLKPGGYLQWSENFPPFWGPVNLETMTQEGELTQFHKLTEPYSKLFEKFAWVTKLGQIMKDSGFEDVQSHIPSVRKEVLQDESRLMLWIANNASKIRKTMMPEELRGKTDESIRALEKGVRDGILLAYYLNIVSGRKPLGDPSS